MMARVWQSMGLAFLFVPISTAAFYYIPKAKINNATGIMNLARNIGGSFGIAQVTTMLARRAQFHQNILITHLTPLDSRYQAALTGTAQTLILRGSDPIRAANQAQGLLYGLLQRHATMLAFVDSFWLMGVTFLALVPLMFLMKKAEPGKAPAGVH